MNGTGRFEPTEGTNPHIGAAGKTRTSKRELNEVSLPAPEGCHGRCAMLTRYEEAAYHLSRLDESKSGGWRYDWRTC